MNQQNAQKDLLGKWNEFRKMEDEMAKKKREMNEEMDRKKRKIMEEIATELKMKDEMDTKKRKMMDEIMKEMIKKDEENAELKKENCILKEKIANMKAFYKKELKSLAHRRRLSAELLNELFFSMPLENAFGLLAKIPNGLLARNIQKMINGIKEALKNNKLNVENLGPKLTISEDGFIAKHSGPKGDNCALAILPIPSFNLSNIINKPIIVFYFELQILNKSNESPTIGIGFCDHKFPLENKWFGGSNSIGIYCKVRILIDRFAIVFRNGIEEDFNEGDMIGIGIIHQPNSKMECFCTWNEELLGKVALPTKFANIQLLPAINLEYNGESILANFGINKWSFKEFESVLE